MKSESAELVSGLIRQYRRLRLLYLGYLAAAVLALVFFFVDKRVTLALVAASLVYHLVVVRRAGKAYQRAFVHACGQCTLARRLQDARHTEAPTLEEGELRRARLVAANSAKGSSVGGGALRCYHGRRVRLGDAGFSHSFSRRKTPRRFVVGTWVTVELGKDTGLDWRLIHERVMMKPSRDAMLRRESGLRRVVGFGPGWMEDGTWFGLRPEGKPDVPGDAFLAALRRLSAATDKLLAVCVQRDRLHVFVCLRIPGPEGSQPRVRRAPPWRVSFSPSWTEFSRPRTPWYKPCIRRTTAGKACGAWVCAYDVPTGGDFMAVPLKAAHGQFCYAFA